PDQTVVPVAVAEVLVGVAGPALGGVVAATPTGVRREEHGALVEVEADVALEPDRMTGVGATRDDDGAPTGRRGGVDGVIDRIAVDRRAVALGAEVAHIEPATHRRRGDGRRGARRTGVSSARCARAGDAGEEQRKRETSRAASSHRHVVSHSRWNTSRNGWLRGLSSGLVGMMSRMYVHHRRHTSVSATAFQRASFSIST